MRRGVKTVTKRRGRGIGVHLFAPITAPPLQALVASERSVMLQRRVVPSPPAPWRVRECVGSVGALLLYHADGQVKEE